MASRTVHEQERGLAPARRRGPLRVSALLVLWLGVGGLLLASCGEDSPLDGVVSTLTTQPGDGGGEAPPETDPPATEAPPPEETAPPEAPETPETPAEPEEDPALSATDWLILAAIAIAAIAIFSIANSGANRRAQSKAAARTQLQGQLSEIIGGSRWVHDSGSLEVLLATDPNQIQTAWNEVRRRMVTVESQIATLAVGSGDPALDQSLRYLGQCIADLRGAEEAYASAKFRFDGSDSQAELLRRADDTVMARRQQLQAAIDPVAFAMRG